jgi:hypothetical protein
LKALISMTRDVGNGFGFKVAHVTPYRVGVVKVCIKCAFYRPPSLNFAYNDKIL